MFDKSKICGIHGVLTPEETLVEKSKSGYARRCKKCREAARNRWALKRSEIACPFHGELTLDDMYADGRCKACVRDKYKEYKEENKEKLKEKNRKSNEKRKNKDINRDYKKEYQDKKERHGKLYSLHKQCKSHKMELQDYFDMVTAQDNKCAICGNEETRICGVSKNVNRLCIDHCHETKKVRELLCHSCNTGIGKFKENEELLMKAMEYLRKHNADR